MSDDRDYEVGYKKPPKPSRFKKGESGNPSGKKKGSPNRAKRLEEFFETPIIVNDRGRRRRMTPELVVVTTLLSKAVKGDVAAAKAILKLWSALAPGSAATERNTADLQAAARRFDEIVGRN